MRIYVQGLWHLGIVTAACLASVGHDIIGFDNDINVINSLNSGKSIIFEPGLDELINAGLKSGKLKFSSEINNIDFLLVAYDTPIDDNDIIDVNFVISRIESMIPSLNNEAIIMISSQMPVGSIKYLEEKFRKYCPEKNISFVCFPENLRLGNALNVFLKPDRIIIGYRSNKDKLIVKKLLEPITDKIEWMSIESAEMTKHAINSFLATSVVFANEIASICEKTGADSKEVERGLKSDQRIGNKAYLSPGSAFSGGTLARDVDFLKEVSKKNKLFIPLLESIKISNNNHKLWTKRKIQELFPSLKGITITVWGITYKSGTNTLRKSLTVELCNWMISQEANIQVYDPIVEKLPPNWYGRVHKFDNMLESLHNTQLLLIGTKYDEYDNFFQNYIPENKLLIIDPNRSISFLEKNKEYNYMSVGSYLKVI